MRANGKTMGLIAQAFDEIEHRITRRQLERLTAWNKKGFPAGIAVRPFGDAHDRNLDSKAGQNLPRSGELPLSAVDQQEIRPGRIVRPVTIRTAFPPPLGGKVRGGSDRRMD